MEIIKIVGIALTAIVIIVIIKQYKPEFAIYVSLAASILIMFLFMNKLLGVVSFISDFSEKISRKQGVFKNSY